MMKSYSKSLEYEQTKNTLTYINFNTLIVIVKNVSLNKLKPCNFYKSLLDIFQFTIFPMDK